jgi:outer membrane protein insertion porin family
LKIHHKFIKTPLAAIAVSLLSAPLMAADPFVVKDIRVEGLQRVEPGTVFSYLPVRVGETFTDDKGADAIRALYNTGFFKDVKVESDGQVLVVKVEERPSVSQLEFTGIKEFDKDALKKSLRAVGVAEARYYDKALIDKAEQELKRQYVSRGFYAAEVVTTVTPVERNRVAIVFNVDEGQVSKILQINIVGNQAFKEKQLREEMQLSTPNWLSWYTKNDLYSKQKLTADLEAIRSFYLNRGYLEFVIESTQVSISPDKKGIYLNINIREGQQYKVASVKLAGELLGKDEELTKLVNLKVGDVFSSAKLTESTKAIADKLGAYGYAFAAINPQPNLQKDKQVVDLSLIIDPGKRTYVRKINISGNNKTRDEVIRREMRQLESSWFDSEKLKLSKDRINRLGYFTDVEINTEDIPGTSDQVDVGIKVAEKPTGSLSLGAGVSSTDKLILTAGISQENAFGTGTSIGFNINTGKINRTLSIANYDPYFTEDGISRFTEVYTRTSRPLYYTGDTEYKIVSSGGSFKLGVPYSEVDRVFFGLGIEQLNMESSINTPTSYQNYVAAYGKSNMNVPFTIGWSRDSRDSALIPSRGTYQQTNFEWGTPVADLQYYRAYYQHQYFLPLFKGNILSFNGEIGYGDTYSNKPFPVTKNYFVGGIGSVRGYQPGSLGPTSTNATTGLATPVGGASKLVGNMEYTFPLPGSGVDKTLRIFSFFDAGNVYENTPDLSGLRTSYGFGLSWISPLGPLKFSYGFPMSQKPGDRLQRFQFQIGTAF